MISDNQNEAKQQILGLCAEYCRKFMQEKPFAPGDGVRYAGRVFDEDEITSLVDSSLEFWLTAGRYAAEFEKKFAEYLGVSYCSLVNSGSSAILLALAALTAQELGERRLKRGDEVITVACGFPTTVSPILFYGAVPVFADVALPSYNIDPAGLEQALSPKTKAVILAHTLGNPFDLNAVKDFCDKHGLWLVEDNCDALGAEYCYHGSWKKTGTIGDIGCSSFYPAHQMTMGEGGAVYTSNRQLARILKSFRDWGRDCCCPPGVDNFCGHRFDRQYGELPRGYDHKYVYSHFGFNLKVTDMQAAIGCAQLKKMPYFVEKRRAHWQYYREQLDDLSNVFILPEPETDSRPCWFGFALTVREDAPFSKDGIVQHLEKNKIQTRAPFAGNFTRHPCFDPIRNDPEFYRVSGALDNTDRIMNRTFWIGVYPGLTQEKQDFVLKTIKDFCR